MSINNVILAVEDQLSEVVSTKILNQFGIGIRSIILGKGNIYLRQKAPELNRAANGVDIFLLTGGLMSLELSTYFHILLYISANRFRFPSRLSTKFYPVLD